MNYVSRVSQGSTFVLGRHVRSSATRLPSGPSQLCAALCRAHNRGTALPPGALRKRTARRHAEKEKGGRHGKSLLIALSLLALLTLRSFSNDSLVRFDGGIGVIPVSSGVGTAATATVVNRNIVRGVQPPGQIWVIANLKADVTADGRRHWRHS